MGPVVACDEFVISLVSPVCSMDCITCVIGNVVRIITLTVGAAPVGLAFVLGESLVQRIVVADEDDLAVGKLFKETAFSQFLPVDAGLVIADAAL